MLGEQHVGIVSTHGAVDFLLWYVALVVVGRLANPPRVADTRTTGPTDGEAAAQAVHVFRSGVDVEFLERDRGIVAAYGSPGCQSGRGGAADQRLSGNPFNDGRRRRKKVSEVLEGASFFHNKGLNIQ